LFRATSLNRSCVRRTRWKRLIGSRVCCFAALRWLQRRAASSIVSQSLAVTFDAKSRENRAMSFDLVLWMHQRVQTCWILHPYESWMLISEQSRANWMRPSKSLSLHSREGEKRISSITIQSSIKQQRKPITQRSLEAKS